MNMSHLMTGAASSQQEETNVDPSLATLSRKCSNCGQTGHNSRTCLEIRDSAVSEAEPKLNAASSLNTQASLHATEQQADKVTRDEEAEVSDCSVDISRETKKKGIAWTEDEHKLFLKGLQKLGKGDWRGISRQFVQTRSPTQVASHAQKYFIRQSITGKRKRRSSLFDLVPDGVQDGKSAVASPVVQQSKEAVQASSRLSGDAVQPPVQAFPPMPQGPEAFAFACWYQSMLLQQGSMAWIQALYGSQSPFNPNNAPLNKSEAQGGQVAGAAGPGLTREKQMAIASLAAQQQAAAYMAQQHLSAAAAMGAIPYPPTHGAATGKAPMADIRGLYQPEESESTYSRQPSISALPTQQTIHRAGSLNMKNQGLLKQGNEQAPGEVFGNGRLVRPKAHRAQSGRSYGSIPSYMSSSQSEGQTQFSGNSKESDNSLARLWGMSSMPGPTSYTAGSLGTFNRSLGLEKSTASEGSKTLKHFNAS